MKNYIIILVFLLVCISCKNYKENLAITNQNDPLITCTDSHCSGTYNGAEFINKSDIAHQFSNTMSKIVGDKLKDLYAANKYVKVDFKNIEMSTIGMGSGQVAYYLFIPFKTVTTSCDAYTSFDHVGGWNHPPALQQRKTQLSLLLMKNEELNISTLKKTPEGLEEYWIQWKHKNLQKDCE